MTPNQLNEAQVLLQRYNYLKRFLEMPKNSSVRIIHDETKTHTQINQEDLIELAKLMLPKVEAALIALGVEFV